MSRGNPSSSPVSKPLQLESLATPPVPAASRTRRKRPGPGRIPWTIYGYISGEVLRVFLLGVLAISLVYTSLAAYQTVRSGLQLGFVWPLLLSTVAYPLYFSIPVSFLFAVTLVVGRLVGDLEVNAFRTHGLSYVHVYTPVLGIGVLLTAFSIYLNGWLIPRIHYERRNLQSYVLKQIENLGSGVNRTILLPDGEGSLWVGAYSGTQLERVRVDIIPDREGGFVPSIREHLPEKLPGKITILAQRGHIDIQPDRKSLVLNLRSVDVLIPEVVKGSPAANEVFHQKFRITDNVLIPLSFLDKSPGTKDLSSPELLRYIQHLKGKPRSDQARDGENLARASFNDPVAPSSRKGTLERRIASAVTEFHRRQAFAFSCITFPLLGVALALFLDKQSRIVPFFFGNLAVIGIYFPLLMVAISLGDKGIVPFVSLLLPNFALLAAGILLTKLVVKK